MLTRFQHKANIYATVFENPLLLNNILTHLEAKDGVNILITNASFTKEDRFVDTMHIFLTDRKDVYEQKQKENRMDKFHDTTQKIFRMITEYQHFNENFNKEQHFRNVNSLFDYIIENEWIFEEHDDLEETENFKIVIEKKLVEFMIQEPEYTWNSLYYLEKLCNISINAENDENDDIVEFILTSDGEKIYV